MKRKILTSITALLLVCLCGCQNGQTDKTTKAEKKTTEDLKPLAFAAITVRTDGYHEDATYPSYLVINSKSGLEKYYTATRDRYFLERRATVFSDTPQGFLDAADKYDDAFFQNHLLVLVLLEESSGSVRHEVTKVAQNKTETEITIRRDVPKVGTDDMAEWHIFVELNSAEYNGTSVKVIIETAKLRQTTEG